MAADGLTKGLDDGDSALRTIFAALMGMWHKATATCSKQSVLGKAAGAACVHLAGGEKAAGAARVCFFVYIYL